MFLERYILDMRPIAARFLEYSAYPPIDTPHVTGMMLRREADRQLEELGLFNYNWHLGNLVHNDKIPVDRMVEHPIAMIILEIEQLVMDGALIRRRNLPPRQQMVHRANGTDDTDWHLIGLPMDAVQVIRQQIADLKIE